MFDLTHSWKAVRRFSRVAPQHTVSFLALMAAGVAMSHCVLNAIDGDQEPEKQESLIDAGNPLLPPAVSSLNTTPEHNAWVKANVFVSQGDAEALEKMLENDASLVTRTFDKKVETTLLHEACEFNQVECARVLLNRGADPLAISRKWNRDTPLHLAAKVDSVSVIKLLLDKQVDINLLGGGPPERGRNPHFQYKYHSPLDIASTAGSDHAVALLLERGAKIDVNPPESSYSALHRAMEGWYDLPGYGNLKRQFDPNTRAATGNRKVIELLLKHGASLDDRDFYGNKPFHIAVYRCSSRTVEYLLDAYPKSVDVNEPGQFRCTPLHLVAFGYNRRDEGKWIDIIHLLLKAGADKLKLGGPSEPPKTAFDYAREQGCSEAVLELLR